METETLPAVVPQPQGLQRVKRLLRGVKLNKNGGLTINWKDTYFDPVKNRTINVEDEKTSDAVAHMDFHACLSKFHEHLMLACEWVKTPKERPAFDGTLSGSKSYRVGTITLRGGEDDKPVQVFIFGNKKLSHGRVTNFGTYGIKLDHAQEPYLYAAELHHHVDDLEDEVWLYMEGKAQEPAQVSMDLSGAGSDEGSTLAPQE